MQRLILNKFSLAVYPDFDRQEDALDSDGN